MVKKIYAILTVFFMLVAMVSLTNVPVKALESSWSDDGIRAVSFSNESTNSIEITSASELGLLAYNVNNGTSYEGYTITLGNDIDLSGHDWDPIGHYSESSITTAKTVFKGHFNGAHHVISHMNIEISEVDDHNHAFGLFGGVLKGSVKNLKINDASIEIGNSTTSICAGVAAGFFAGSEVENITIADAEINIYGNSSVYAGGLSGSLYNSGSWTNSQLSNIFVSDILISAQSSKADEREYQGGLIGFGNEYPAPISNCYAKNISFAPTDSKAVGNIVGYNNGTMLNYCYADGNPLVGQNGPYPGTVTNSCTETNGLLENAVIIDEKSYDTLVGAMNAWVTDNGGSNNFQLWTCDDLGVDHRLEVKYVDEHNHQLICSDCTYSVNEVHQTVLENDKEATCSSEGYTGDEVCEICHNIINKGEIIKKLDHHFVDGKCSVCGIVDPDYHVQTDENHVTDTTQKTDTVNNTVNTGDHTNITMWFVLFIISIAAVSGFTVYKKI